MRVLLTGMWYLSTFLMWDLFVFCGFGFGDEDEDEGEVG